MSTTFTAGPWTHEGQGDITGIENDEENGCFGKVDVAGVYLRTVKGKHEANARLIAAAPDLYEALHALVNEPTKAPDFLPSRLWDAARAALAKAEGKS